MKPRIGLEEHKAQGVLAILNSLLADEYLLYTKTRKFHWNVVGPQFNDLHKFFESQYEALDESIDEVAERARMLGGVALGTLQEFSSMARLREAPGKNPPALDMVAALLDDHEHLVRQLRGDVDVCTGQLGDAGTADFLTGLLEQHEKMAWMLRSFLARTE